ncbi:MAG TPA: hypothetical protein VJP04_03030 [Terriglobales bacterium]|nr:hypothetical protein [Terriglobales bacterium]
MLRSALERPTGGERVIEAAYLMLDMESEREGWTATDYAVALGHESAV